jgi:hypothetical protein
MFMPKFDPFNSSIVNAEQESAFQDKFVDDGKAEEGVKRVEKSTPTVSATRSNRFSRFSSNAKTSNTTQDEDDDIFSETSSSNQTLNANSAKSTINNTVNATTVNTTVSKTIEKEVQAPINTASSSATGSSRFSRFSVKNKEAAPAHQSSEVKPTVQTTEPLVIEKNQEPINESTTEVNSKLNQSSLEQSHEEVRETKPTGRARFALGRKPISSQEAPVEALVPEVSTLAVEVKTVEPTIEVSKEVEEEKTQITEPAIVKEEPVIEKTEVNTKSTRFSFRKPKETEPAPVSEVKSNTTLVQTKEVNQVEKLEKAPWEDDDSQEVVNVNSIQEQKATTIEVIATEEIVEVQNEVLEVAPVEEAKKKFSLKKKSNLEAELTKKTEESLEKATQSSDSTLLSTQSVEKISQDQLNAVEKRAKIENEVENATNKNHTQPQNDDDVFKLDFDSAVVEANNNKKGEKMSFEKEEPKKNAKKQYTPEEQEEFQKKKAAFKALAEKVDTIKLREVFEMVGAHNNEDKIRNKWKMPWGDNVSLKGQQWYNHNGSTGGWGAIIC